MDTYEKWFDKVEAEKEEAEADDIKNKLNDKVQAEKKQTEADDIKNKLNDKVQVVKEQTEAEGIENKLNDKVEEETRLSDIIPEVIKSPGKSEVKKNLCDNEEDKKKLVAENETKEALSEKQDEKIGHLQKYKKKLSDLIKSRSNKKPPVNVKPKDKPNDQIKVFEFSKDISTVEIIYDIWTKDVQLKNRVLVVENNLDKNGFKDEMLTMIKTSGIDYIIAPGFEKGFYEKASDAELQLIECSDTKLIDEGMSIMVYREAGVIFDVDNGQEFKFTLMTDSVRKNILQKISLEVGESVLIGNDLSIRVLDIEKDQSKICINALKVVTAYPQKYLTIGDEIRIIIFKIIPYQIKLGIEVPECITINRQ
ncbi:3-isopropylmalate dehydratase small subunit [Candidatus Scalindua japonica]|uniref:3-isopropylmalate dehydratase small subunit n=1 Tax=Candidatus Scalindua japonica TaxID=1284222 RepID=A0A286TXH7_9BACT|nr:carbon storage regulator [Candidatus Scalindua japonica]GAX60564.1 3-isopropylmalate dehydratase small subunit [Candidatus Scalindua japonica]